MESSADPHLVRHRYREIGRVLAHYGFSWLWTRFGIGRIFGNLVEQSTSPDELQTQPQRLRMCLEELGATAIKLGQMLSTRPDLLPPEYIAELKNLQDQVVTVPYPLIAQAIEREFGCPPEEVFRSFEVTPRAAGSMAQVHSAVLPDGAEVVVKVRRPGIDTQVDLDLTILRRLARLLAQNVDLAKNYDVEGLVEQFDLRLRNELDFTREGHSAERIDAQFAEDPALHVPTVYWDFSGCDILTMEEIHGIKIDDLAALDAAGIDRSELARKCAHIALVQVLGNGFFHADPHPGNFFVRLDGTVALIDYGMVGQISEQLRETLLRSAIALSRRDSARLADELLTVGAPRRPVDRRALIHDLEHLIARYEGSSLGQISFAKVLRDVSAISQKYTLTLPADLVALARVVAMDEGLGSMLDPDFKLMEFSKPYLEEFWKKSHSLPEVLKRRGTDAIYFADFVADLPDRVMRLSGMAERGEVIVTTRLEGKEDLTKEFRRAVDRISVSILATGLIVGFSVLVLVYRPANSEGVGSFLIRAFLFLAVAAGVWLVATYLKPRRS